MEHHKETRERKIQNKINLSAGVTQLLPQEIWIDGQKLPDGYQDIQYETMLHGGYGSSYRLTVTYCPNRIEVR